jgi:predicted metal-dependent hydrolase
MAAEPEAVPPRPRVEVRRSARRRRTVSAYRAEDGTVVVLLPARMSRAEEQEWVEVMLARVQRSEKRRRPSDTDLERRAALLSERYLEGLARPRSVRWVANQQQRWGSCTPADSSIRLSSRLQGMPAWVVDYVLLHELAHLLESGHTPTFWRLVERYPRAERARGFLEGLALASGVEAYGEPSPEPSPGEVDELVQ